MTEWRKDCFGYPRRALYLGSLYTGCILQGTGSNNPKRGLWCGWFMSGDEGNETGWFVTADEARASVEAALTAALKEVKYGEKE